MILLDKVLVPKHPFFPVSSGEHVVHFSGVKWEDSTKTAHDEHRQTCLIGCDWCDGHRGVGFCPACKTEREGDDNDMCVTCREARVQFGDDDRRHR